MPSAAPLYLWRQHRHQPYIGDAEARYQTIPVAMGWIDLILKCLDYRSLDESGLSANQLRRYAGLRSRPICDFSGTRLPRPRSRFGGSRPGAIAQLGERLNGIQEVGGSTPPGSTK